MSDSTRITRRDAAMVRSSSRAEQIAPPPTPTIAPTPTKRPWGRIAVAALLVGVLVWQVSKRTPCGPSAGSLEVKILGAAVSPASAARMKIGTFNIHHGTGVDRVRNLDRTAEVIRGLDFVGLNEVHGPRLWEHDDQATLLGRKLRLAPLFAPAEQEWLHFRTGNGMLSRLDVEHWQIVPLERHYGKSFRNFVHVRTRAPNGVSVNMVVTHIDRSDDRERHEQLRTVGHYFLSLAEPAVLLGDLNSDESEPELKEILAAPRALDALREKYGRNKPRQIDWIIVRGLHVIEAGTIGPGASDHPHLWAEVEVPGIEEEREAGR